MAAIVAPANQNDHLLPAQTIEAIVVERPEPTPDKPQRLCLDGGYNNDPAREVVKEHGYEGHIRPGGVEPEVPKGKTNRPARRWVVERTLAWLSKCRGLLICYERKSEYYLAQLQFACALLWYRHLPDPATAFL